jgi:hypothetical protein
LFCAFVSEPGFYHIGQHFLVCFQSHLL